MTKEDLFGKLMSGKFRDAESSNDVELHSILTEFFKSNICIPKGENRHPYADVLHEWIEGAKIQLRKNPYSDFPWEDLEQFNAFKNCTMRIKPSEPVYEWQCLYRPYTRKEYKILTDNNGFFTEAEMMRWKAGHGDSWCIKPIEETKRIRQ